MESGICGVNQSVGLFVGRIEAAVGGQFEIAQLDDVVGQFGAALRQQTLRARILIDPRRGQAARGASFKFPAVDAERNDERSAEVAPCRVAGAEILVGQAGGRDRQLFTGAKQAVEAEAGDDLSGAEDARHGIIGVDAGRDRAIAAGQYQHRTAGFLAAGEHRIENEARRFARDQELALQFALLQMRLARKRRKHRGHALAHWRRDRLEIHAFDETVDDAQSDTGAVFEFLGKDDDAGERITGADVNLLQSVGKLENVGNRDPLADQRRGKRAPRRNEIVELARDVETEELEAELLACSGMTAPAGTCGSVMRPGPAGGVMSGARPGWARARVDPRRTRPGPEAPALRRSR